MWKNEEQRILCIKQMAKESQEIFERALINRNKGAINQMIYELKKIKEVLEFGEALGGLATEILDLTDQKLEKEPQSRKEKN